MKRSLPLLLAALLLVCGLTACGRSNAPANTGTNGAGVTDNGSRAPENGTVNNGVNSGTADNGGGTGSVTNDVGNAIEDAGRDVRNGVNDVGNALAGGGAGVNSGVGYSAPRTNGSPVNGLRGSATRDNLY